MPPSLNAMDIDERLRAIELQVTRLVAHAESEKGTISRLFDSLNKKIDEHRIDFKDHTQTDELNFKRIDKTIYIASGALMMVVFILKLFK